MFNVFKRLFRKHQKTCQEVQKRRRVVFVQGKYSPVEYAGTPIWTRSARSLVRNEKYREEIVFQLHGELVKTQLTLSNVIQLIWDLEEPAYLVFHRSQLTVEETFIIDCLQKCPYYCGYVIRTEANTYCKIDASRIRKAS